MTNIARLTVVQKRSEDGAPVAPFVLAPAETAPDPDRLNAGDDVKKRHGVARGGGAALRNVERGYALHRFRSAMPGQDCRRRRDGVRARPIARTATVASTTTRLASAEMLIGRMRNVIRARTSSLPRNGTQWRKRVDVRMCGPQPSRSETPSAPLRSLSPRRRCRAMLNRAGGGRRRLIVGAHVGRNPRADPARPGIDDAAALGHRHGRLRRKALRIDHPTARISAAK